MFFSPLCETLYASCWKLFAEASKLSLRSIYARRRPQNGFLGVHPSESQRDGSQRRVDVKSEF